MASPILNIFRIEDGSFIDPELQHRVEAAIREYPVQNAPQWLGGVAAIRAIEDWLSEHGHEARRDDDG